MIALPLIIIVKLETRVIIHCLELGDQIMNGTDCTLIHDDVTGYLYGEFIGLRWIPRTKASDAELWCFFDLHLDGRLSKHSWGWWLERHRAHYDVRVMYIRME